MFRVEACGLAQSVRAQLPGLVFRVAACAFGFRVSGVLGYGVSGLVGFRGLSLVFSRVGVGFGV